MDRTKFEPVFGPDDWRNRSNLNKMTISELVSELRDTFIMSDFDVVEETLIAREERLKGEIDQKKNEIKDLEEKFDILMLEKVSVEMELKRLKEERSNGELGFGRCSSEVVKKRKVGNGFSCGGGGFEGGRVLVKGKRGVGEQSKKDGVGASGDNFDRVDETLVVREAMLKQATEEKVRELLENSRFKSWGMLNFEIEVNTGERHGKEIMKLGENEKYKIEVLKNRGVGDGEACSVVELEGENVEVLAKTLVVREAMLKAAAEENVRELQENNLFNSWGRLNFEVEVKTVTGERREEELMKAGESLKAAVGHEKGKFEGLKNRGVGNGESCAVAELDVGKVEVLGKKKRFVGEPNKKDGGASDTERLSSSRVVKANLATRLAKPIDIMSGNDISREEPLGFREAKLKEEIEEKIRLLHRKNQFKSLGIHDFDVEAQKVNGERCGKGNVLKAELGNERHKLVVKNSGVVDGEACAVSELKDENVKDLAERKRLAGEPSKKDGLGSSDAGKKSSFGAVRRNFATKLAEPSRIFNRDSATPLRIAATLDILEDLSSDSSSSSSSSFGEFDFTFLNSNKKIKTSGDQR